MFSSASELRHWLTTQTTVTLYGAKLLNMLYSPQQKAELITIYSEVAQNEGKA